MSILLRSCLGKNFNAIALGRRAPFFPIWAPELFPWVATPILLTSKVFWFIYRARVT